MPSARLLAADGIFVYAAPHMRAQQAQIYNLAYISEKLGTNYWQQGHNEMPGGKSVSAKFRGAPLSMVSMSHLNGPGA